MSKTKSPWDQDDIPVGRTERSIKTVFCVVKNEALIPFVSFYQIKKAKSYCLSFILGKGVNKGSLLLC